MSLCLKVDRICGGFKGAFAPSLAELKEVWHPTLENENKVECCSGPIG